jgi:ArsR family transcriptional regulator
MGRKKTDKTIAETAELFYCFSDITRLRILSALFDRERAVTELVKTVGMSQSAVSHQLKILRTNKLIKFRKAGNRVYYSLDDDHVRSIIEIGFEHVAHTR